jgi:hypothetical protein
MGGSLDQPTRVLSHLLAAVDEALGLLDLGAPAAAASSNGVSAWSPLQHLEHVGLSNRTIARAVRAIEAGKGEPDQKPSLRGAVVLKLGRIPRGRARHPEAAAPRPQPSPDAVRALLEETRGEFEVFRPQLQDLAERPQTVSHFALGAFTAIQWMRFADVHTRHHLRIVREILKKAVAP